MTNRTGPKNAVQILSMNLSGNYTSDGNVNARVVLFNPTDGAEDCLLVLQVMNPKDEPLPPDMSHVTVDAGDVIELELRVDLPPQTRNGQYLVQAQLLTGRPMEGGYLKDLRGGSFTV